MENIDIIDILQTSNTTSQSATMNNKQLSEDQQLIQKLKQQEIYIANMYGFQYKKDFQILKIPIKITQNMDIDVADIHIIKFKFRDLQQEQNNGYKSKNRVKRVNKHIVFLHGFGACSAYYFQVPQMIQQLMIARNEQNRKILDSKVIYQYSFSVYMVDIIGQGLSQRFNYKERSRDLTQDFYIQFLQQTFSNLNLKNIILIGHSFGGYISTLYTINNMDNIEKLILLSPVGITDKLYDWKSDDKQYPNKMGYIYGQWLKICEYCGNNKITPHELARKLDKFYLQRILSSRFIKRQISFGQLDQQIVDILIDFGLQMINLPRGTDISIFSLLNSRIVPYESIESIIWKYDITKPIYFIYGKDDWNDYSGVLRMQNLNERFKKNIHLELLQNTGHQIVFQNPIDLKTILEKQIF